MLDRAGICQNVVIFAGKLWRHDNICQKDAVCELIFSGQAVGKTVCLTTFVGKCRMSERKLLESAVCLTGGTFGGTCCMHDRPTVVEKWCVHGK
jgi:hypothetical protein